MENIDLDIDNYNLNELLNLFKLDVQFDKKDLKNAKKVVHMTHPDKSKLDKKYFLFYTKAYKRLFFIHEFKETQDGDFNAEYVNVLKDYYNTYKDQHDIKKEDIDKTFDVKDYDKFNKNFNALFEENRMKNDYQETGYNDWLKSDSDELLMRLNERNINKDEQQHLINEYKTQQRQLVKHEGIVELESKSGYSDITSNAPTSYGSDVFSKLPFEDLKKAHNETLIIVNDQDMRKETFHNISQLKEHRNTQDMTPLSIEQSKKMLSNREKESAQETNQRAFFLAKEAQEANDIHNKVKKSFNLLR